jgi:hypothetical protein
MRNTRSEHFTSDVPSITDIARTSHHVRFVPIGDPQIKARIANFAAEPMPMPGHILNACWPAAVTKSL